MNDAAKRHQVERARIEGCRACVYFTVTDPVHNIDGMCSLNPVSVPASTTHWCGQWLKAAPGYKGES